jgi:hypothetical protein
VREVNIQKSILDLTEQAGGYGWKLSNAYISGVPDLLLFWPSFAPVIAEVKYLGVKAKTFDVQINLTALQRERLRRVDRLGPFSMVLVAVKWKGTDHVIGCKWDEERVASSSIGGERSTIRRKGQFNLGPILGWAGVPGSYRDRGAPGGF